MARRKWCVRGLVIGVIAVAAVAFYLYQHWTDPAVVRVHVLTHLEKMFPGAAISLDSARLRILGGISLNEMHLARRDDDTEVLHIPAAVLYHDKEKLLEGPVKIRKVELDRPRLRLVRNEDGKWNIAGLSGPVQSEMPLPTLVIHQGTLILEDRLANKDIPPVEISHVNLTLVNDPLPTVLIDGRARSEVVGELEIHGTWNRVTKEATLSAQVQGMDVSAAMLQRVASNCPNSSLQGLQLEGRADIKADLGIMPTASNSLSFDVRCRLTKGKLQHPQLPLPLDDLSATVRATNGQLTIETLQAKSGPAQISLRGSAMAPCPMKHFEGVLEVKHLQLCRELFERLPDKLKRLRDSFAPTGSATLRVSCARRDDHWVALHSGEPSTLSLLPESLRVSFSRFPYPLERITGALDLNLLSNRIGVDVVGYSGTQPVAIKGYWHGAGKDLDACIDIQAADIPLDEKLLHALRFSAFEKLARSFHARGKGDIKAVIRHTPGAATTFANEYRVFFHDSSVHWDQFPYRLTEVSGFLDIYPGRWEFRDFQGKHLDATVRVDGKTQSKSTATGNAEWLVVRIGGKNVSADEDLKAAFRPFPPLTRAWELFQFGGRLDFNAVVQRPIAVQGPDAESRVFHEMEVEVESSGGAIQPRFFPLQMTGLSGRLHYHDNRLELTNYRASHGQAQLALKAASVNLGPGGSFFADLNDLQAQRLLLDDDFVDALPKALKSTVSYIALKDPVQLQTDLKVSMAAAPGSLPDIYWDGKAWLDRASLRTGIDLSEVRGIVASRGRYWRPTPEGRQALALNGNFRLEQATSLKQPFRDVIGHFQVQEQSPEVLTLGVRAPLFGGDLSGEGRFEFGPRLRYELNLTASQIDLQQFGRHNLGPNAQLTGTAVGRLYLNGQGTGLDSLDGNGRLDVPRGHLYNLPLLLDLLKFLGLRWPDRTMFDEAHALFELRSSRVHVSRLELLGNAISLYGNGDFRIDGSDLKLDFYPSWGRVEQLVPPSLRYIPAEIGKRMLKIEMRGKVGGEPGDLKFTKRPVPMLLDPVIGVRERMGGKDRP